MSKRVFGVAAAGVVGLSAALGWGQITTRASEPEAAPPPASNQAGPETEVDRARLLEELKALPVKRSPNGSDEHRAGLRRTEEMLLEKLRGMGYEPVIHEVDWLGSGSSRRARGEQDDGARREAEDDANTQPWRNIIVEMPGRGEGGLADEVLVFGAHFDAVVRAPGADDNGTGTVALLEMARLLKDRPMQRTVRLAFFNLEEVGLVGSRAYVESIEDEIKGERIEQTGPDGQVTITRRPPAKRFVGMASIDGVGYFTDEPNSQKSPIPESRLFKPPSVGDFLALGGIARHRVFSRALVKAMQESAPDLKIIAVDFLPIPVPDLLRSDHAPFLGQNVPAVILADTANFRSPHYHQPTDTVETLDMTRYTLVVKALVGAAYRLAGPVGAQAIELRRPRTGASKDASENGQDGAEPIGASEDAEER